MRSAVISRRMTTMSTLLTRSIIKGSIYSGVMGGVSISWNWMFSNGAIPGVGLCVVWGNGAISGSALVRAAIKDDLPVLGGPMTITWAAPSLSMANTLFCL